MSEEVIVDTDKFTLSSIKISNPVKTGIGYFGKMTYDDKPIHIQTPLCTVIGTDNIKGKGHMTIHFSTSDNFSFLQFLYSAYEIGIHYITGLLHISDALDVLKGCDGSESSVRAVYDCPVHVNSNKFNTLRVKTNKSTVFRDINYNEIHASSIDVDDKVVCILKTNGLVFDEKSVNQAWTCEQCLLYKKKE